MHSWDQVNLLTYNCNSLGILHVLMIRWNFHFGVSGLLHLQKEEETYWENFPQFQGNLLWSNEHNWQYFVQNIKLKPENFTDFLIHEVRIVLPAELFLLTTTWEIRAGWFLKVWSSCSSSTPSKRLPKATAGNFPFKNWTDIWSLHSLVQVFTKMPPSSNISASTTPYSFGISPHCYNPSFTPFYGKVLACSNVNNFTFTIFFWTPWSPPNRNPLK